MRDEVAVGLQNQMDKLGIQLDTGLTVRELSEGVLVPGQLAYRDSVSACEVLYSHALTVTAVSKHYALGAADLPLFVLGPRITERSAAMFRDLDVNFLDQAGNASIRFDSVLIDVRGRRSLTGDGVINSADIGRSGAVNLFSAKRAQVIFALLSWPELIQGPMRSTAQVAQVSLGQVQDTLKLLEARNYVIDPGNGRRRLSKTDELSELWAHSYSSGLGAAVSLHALQGNIENLVAAEGPHIYVSGEFAVSERLHPKSLTLYAEGSPKELIVANRWRPGALPNVFLRQKFWTHPGDGADQHPGEFRQVPVLLVYADLLGSNDPRQREVAEQLRMDNAELQRL